MSFRQPSMSRGRSPSKTHPNQSWRPCHCAHGKPFAHASLYSHQDKQQSTVQPSLETDSFAHRPRLPTKNSMQWTDELRRKPTTGPYRVLARLHGTRGDPSAEPPPPLVARPTAFVTRNASIRSNPSSKNTADTVRFTSPIRNKMDHSNILLGFSMSTVKKSILLRFGLPLPFGTIKKQEYSNGCRAKLSGIGRSIHSCQVYNLKYSTSKPQKMNVRIHLTGISDAAGPIFRYFL